MKEPLYRREYLLRLWVIFVPAILMPLKVSTNTGIFSSFFFSIVECKLIQGFKLYSLHRMHFYNFISIPIAKCTRKFIIFEFPKIHRYFKNVLKFKQEARRRCSCTSHSYSMICNNIYSTRKPMWKRFSVDGWTRICAMWFVRSICLSQQSLLPYWKQRRNNRLLSTHWLLLLSLTLLSLILPQ